MATPPPRGRLFPIRRRRPSGGERTRVLQSYRIFDAPQIDALARPVEQPKPTPSQTGSGLFLRDLSLAGPPTFGAEDMRSAFPGRFSRDVVDDTREWHGRRRDIPQRSVGRCACRDHALPAFRSRRPPAFGNRSGRWSARHQPEDRDEWGRFRSGIRSSLSRARSRLSNVIRVARGRPHSDKPILSGRGCDRVAGRADPDARARPVARRRARRRSAPPSRSWRSKASSTRTTRSAPPRPGPPRTSGARWINGTRSTRPGSSGTGSRTSPSSPRASPPPGCSARPRSAQQSPVGP